MMCSNQIIDIFTVAANEYAAGSQKDIRNIIHG